MLDLLKIKINGFKLLDDNFMIDLTSKARVYDIDKQKEIKEINKGLYVFRSNVFVGGNSSGKSTVLSLIHKVLTFLQTGRWEFLNREFRKDRIDLEVVFYLNGSVFNYSVCLNKIDNNQFSLANRFSPISNEKLIMLKYNASRGIKNIDLLGQCGEDISQIFNSSLIDTSAITKITNNQVFIDDFSNNSIINLNETILRDTFFTSLNSLDSKLVSAIIRLFDDSIEYIVYDSLDHVRFKRFNEREVIMPKIELMAILSAGTFRGVELYIRCINALKNGKTILVDEIENCFQKNLVYNILFLFNDEKINAKGAKLVFSTHYVEILDFINRRDGIFIMHKNNGIIKASNLYSDYDVRTELLKSKQFDNNVFNTMQNYKQILEVRKLMLNEVCINND